MVIVLSRLIDRDRAKRRKSRLVVYGIDARIGGSVARMVAISVTTTSRRVGLIAVAVGGAGVAAFGPLFLPNLGPSLYLPGMVAIFTAGSLLRARTTLVDQTLARAAIRAALTEGRELGPQRWRIDGPAALELGTELRRLQSWWVPGHANAFGYPDPAKEALIAQQATARLASYLGPFTAAERAAWVGSPQPAQLDGAEPNHQAESYIPGQAWPTLDRRNEP